MELSKRVVRIDKEINIDDDEDYDSTINDAPRWSQQEGISNPMNI